MSPLGERLTARAARAIALAFVGAALMAALTACPRHDAATSSGDGASAKSEGGTGGADASGDVDRGPGSRDGGEAANGDGGAAPATSWTEAIRESRYDEADVAIAKLDAAELGKPEVRYARARVAMVLGRHGDVRRHLEKLEEELPLMRDAITKLRAEAALFVGPFEEAAAWFGARSGPADWLLAAEAWDKAADAARARASCDRVIAERRKTRAQEEKARTLRLKLDRAKGDGPPSRVEADARWLATFALDADVHLAASEVLDKLPKPAPLTADELLTRARTLADLGRDVEAERAVTRAASRGGANDATLCRARAEVYYKAKTRYPEAAAAYRRCAVAHPRDARAAEDLFLAARALSRADKDADALTAFASVIAKHPGTPFAEQAAFHVARTHALAGRWADAARAFDDYAKRHPAGSDRKEADRYRALSHLVAQHHKIARKLLEDLAGGESDPVAQARWSNLAALAALRDGDRIHALARWAEMARSRPLTWPALVARARLKEAGATLPPAIDPAEAGDAPAASAAPLPPPADLLHRIGLDDDAEGALRERESVVSGRAGGRGTEALCAAYGELDRGKRRYQIAQQVPAKLLASAPGPKNAWAWDCLFPRPHQAHVRAAEARASLPRDLVWSVMRQESAFDPVVVSPARAVGLMQLMPKTAVAVAQSKGLAHEEAWLTRPPHNVTLGALYLQQMLSELDDVPLAAAAYNAGPEAINRWRARAKGITIDVFVEAIPFVETRGYVVRVMGNLARYGFMDRGEDGVPAVRLEMP